MIANLRMTMITNLRMAIMIANLRVPINNTSVSCSNVSVNTSQLENIEGSQRKNEKSKTQHSVVVITSKTHS